MAQASKTFYGNGTFTPSGGVTQVTVVSRKNPTPFWLQPQTTTFLNFLDANGAVYSMGQGTTGQLGDSSVVTKSTPTLLSSTLSFKQVLLGSNRGFGIAGNGQMYSWGDNSNGTLGVNDVTSRSVPTPVVGGLIFQSVYAMAGGGSYGITPSGVLYAWGVNANGQLGDGTTVNKSSPVVVLGGLTWGAVVSTGTTSMAGITTAGALYAWGANGSGQLGDNTIVAKSSPVAVLGGLVAAQVVGNQFTSPSVHVLTTSGQIYGWGDNSFGQLGDGTILARSTPVLLTGTLPKFKAVYTDGGFGRVAFGMALDGTLYAWGEATTTNKGSSGFGNLVSRSSPVQVAGSLKFSQFHCWQQSSMGVTTAGVLYAWGNNTQGQIPDGSTVGKSSPTLISGSQTWIAAWAWQNGGIGVTTEAKVYIWGQNNNGQLGDNTVVSKSTPTLIAGHSLMMQTPESMVRTTLAVTPGTAYSIKTTQNLVTFGQNVVGSGPADSVTVYYEQ